METAAGCRCFWNANSTKGVFTFRMQFVTMLPGEWYPHIGIGGVGNAISQKQGAAAFRRAVS